MANQSDPIPISGVINLDLVAVERIIWEYIDREVLNTTPYKVDKVVSDSSCRVMVTFSNSEEYDGQVK